MLLLSKLLYTAVLYTFINLCHSQNNQSNPVVTIGDGSVRGKIAQTVGLGKTYYSFRGIPFAEPPIGELRFKPPIKNKKWTGTLDATQDRSECTQRSNPVTGSEDCLYINVYTTTLVPRNLSVLVYIYGGSFTKGNSSYENQGPDYLLDEDIVFVQFNYRLGIFGFLSTADLVCPGNLGLKDQQLALKWIQANIASFGGDPKRVTIFGESAGAASVAYQLQANSSRGLFRAAIMDSGSSLCLWALNRRARRIAFEIGKTLKVDTTNSTTLIAGLRSLNVTTLQEASVSVSNKVTLENPLEGINFSPVIEPYHEGAFFYNYSDKLLSEGAFIRVPTLMGINSNEAAAVGDITGIIRLFLLKYDIYNSLLTPADLSNNSVARAIVGSFIKVHYFGIPPIASQTGPLVQFISDDQFNRPIRRMVINLSKYAPVYFYKFSYEGLLGGTVNRTLEGVGHAEELGYIFRTYHSYTSTPNDNLIRSRMVRMWTNFAKTLRPTPTQDPLLQTINWIRAATVPKNLIYLNIDVEMELALNPYNNNMIFYDDLYKKYGQPPYDTY